MNTPPCACFSLCACVDIYVCMFLCVRMCACVCVCVCLTVFWGFLMLLSAVILFPCLKLYSLSSAFPPQVSRSMRCTVPANLQSREHVRVWPSFCSTSTSSEFPRQYFVESYLKINSCYLKKKKICTGLTGHGIVYHFISVILKERNFL